MSTRAVHHPVYSPSSPGLAEASEAHSRLQYLLNVLPPALREKFRDEIFVTVAEDLPFTAWFYPPRSLVVDADEINDPTTEDLVQFYEAVATIFAEKLRGKSDFKENWFVTQFVNTALTRYEGNGDYVPVIEIPSATNFFLKKIWSSKDSEIDFSKEWNAAEKEAKLADPYRMRRKAGMFLLRSPAVHFFGTAVQEAVSFLKKYEWEFDSVLLGESDPSTLKNRTTFRLQGIWKKFAFFGTEKNGDLWQVYPKATTEARFASPGKASDLLFLGGWQILINSSNRMALDVSPQAGFSTKKWVLYGNIVPGAELAMNFTKIPDEKSSFPLDWQLSAVAQYGFAQYGEPNSMVLGLVFKWAI